MRTLNRYILLCLLCMLAAVSARGADDIRTVEGDYTFYGDGRHSPSECRRLALEYARVDALNKAFGTIVSQDIVHSNTVGGDGESDHFLSLSSSEVKGEWLGDDGEPQYDVSLDKDDNYVVRCRVRGRAKAISNRATDFEALVLRNGTDRRNADTDFRHGDDLYLYLAAPVNGYVAAYLADESGQVYGILPYTTGDVNEIRVRRGKEYVFFDSKAGTEFGNVDELMLTAANGEEFNKIYVMFSPEPFSPAPVKFSVPGAPPSIDAESFTQWLIRCRRNDPRMGVKSINIIIRPDGKKTETIKY